MAVPVVFVANGIALWLLNTFIVALFAGFAIMFPDVVLGLAVDFVNWLIGVINTKLEGYGGELPDLQAAIDAIPPEMKLVMRRIGFPEVLAMLLVASGLRMVGIIWRILFAIKIVT